MENQLARERNLEPRLSASGRAGYGGQSTLFQLLDDPRSNRYSPLLAIDDSTLYYLLFDAFSSIVRLSPRHYFR